MKRKADVCRLVEAVEVGQCELASFLLVLEAGYLVVENRCNPHRKAIYGLCRLSLQDARRKLLLCLGRHLRDDLLDRTARYAEGGDPGRAFPAELGDFRRRLPTFVQAKHRGSLLVAIASWGCHFISP
ncbi:MAG: hypothetical protein ACJ75S_04025 [Solirubrobacterales bacterium]